MSIALVRLDDRLIHGQVVMGWAQPLGIRRIALVDDRVSANDWQQDIYRIGVPPEIAVEFVSLDEGAERFSGWVASDERVLVLVGDIDHAARLCAAADIGALNLGGIHQAEGRTERLAYVFLTDQEVGDLQALATRGVDISAQAVPSSKQVPLEAIV